MSAASGASWLDALARRAVRGEAAADGSAPAALPGRSAKDGFSRRKLLLSSAAAVVLAGPLRLLAPATVSAQAGRESCLENARILSSAGFLRCSGAAAEVYDKAENDFRSAERGLEVVTSGRNRRRLEQIRDRALRRQRRAQATLETCSFKWLRGRRDALERKCPPAGPSPIPGGGDSSPPIQAGPGDCPPTTFGCPSALGGGCCFEGTFCCPSGICCVYDDCRCG